MQERKHGFLVDASLSPRITLRRIYRCRLQILERDTVLCGHFIVSTRSEGLDLLRLRNDAGNPWLLSREVSAAVPQWL